MNEKLYGKILDVMRNISYLQKDDSVSTGGSSYRAISEEKVTTTVRTEMCKVGLILMPVSVDERRDDMEVVRSNGKTGVDRMATVTTTYKIIDVDSGEFELLQMAGTGLDTQDKAIGKAITYAYKYLLLRTFAIPTGEDPDKRGSEDPEPANVKKALLKKITDFVGADLNLKTIVDQHKRTYDVKSISDLTFEQLESLDKILTA